MSVDGTLLRDHYVERHFHILLLISKNPLAFYREYRSLIGNAAHYLFCCRLSYVAASESLLTNLRPLFWRFQSVCEGDLDNLRANYRRTNIKDLYEDN